MSDTVTAPVEIDTAGTTPAAAPAAPLFRFDPGWMFVLAGLAVCCAGVLLPAQADLHALRQQLGELKTEEARWYARLKAHGDFLDQVDREEPDLVRRLAASQLNMIPSNETPVLLAAQGSPPLTLWIDNSAAKVESSPVKPLPISSLSRLANGPDRLWLFAGGIMCVFIGLLMGPGLVRPREKDIETESDLKPAMPSSAHTWEAETEDQEWERSQTATVLVQIESDEEELLTEEQVLSNVLVEVPPASRTMEAKEFPESAASALSSTTAEIGTTVETEPADLDPMAGAAKGSDTTERDDAETPDAADDADKPSSRSRRASSPGTADEDDSDDIKPRSPLVEATDDAGEDDDDTAEDRDEWPMTRRSHRSNRFEDSDEPQERSSRD